MEFLLNNSILIIFSLVTLVLGYSEYKKYLKRTNKSALEVKSLLKKQATEVSKELLAKLLVSTIVSVVISLVSFRELWMNDTFHIVFLTNLLSKPTWKYVKRLFHK